MWDYKPDNLILGFALFPKTDDLPICREWDFMVADINGGNVVKIAPRDLQDPGIIVVEGCRHADFSKNDSLPGVICMTEAGGKKFGQAGPFPENKGFEFIVDDRFVRDLGPAILGAGIRR